MDYLKLGSAKGIPRGQMQQFDIRGKELLVVNLDDQYYCIDARCTHAGAPLIEGSIHDDVLLTCPWHGSCFRITDGAVVDGPATKPLNTYKIEVRDDQLLIAADEIK
jgi:nitrite reductase/ring-hydroxylating ferredoxin subunit